MIRNQLKAKLKRGESVFGAHCFLSDPAIVEIIGRTGFDFVIIDTEHTSKDPSRIEDLVRAAEVTGMTALIRASEPNEKMILRLLETGSHGIVVPYMRDEATARASNDAVRYPPEGARGTCTATRAAWYGSLTAEFGAHVRSCNEELLLIGLIEERDGVANVDSILDAGVDIAWLGRADLSASLGVPGQVEHPTVLAAVDQVIEATKHHPDRWSGIVAYTPEEATRWVARGCRFLVYTSDSRVLYRSYDAAIRGMRAAVAAVELPRKESVSR